ncbi:MAG: adenylate kinase [Candidatus Anoxychlamydiales bacterium]|nr:adenylate kinase [Candidatus Anoxychlamydiales bacterium]NGX36435.1 adenylate kinase [Candidatus Anoxychlamydiales bacterium]
MENLYKSILIYGPPGAGKGTISQVLSLSESVFHLSTGALFRSIDPNSEKGKMIKSYIDKGNLLPDGLTVDLWHEYVEDQIKLKKFKKEQYLLLDGIPRTLKQAVLLEKYIQVEYIIVLQIEDTDKLIARLKNRAKIEGRMDDLDETILKKRMDIYLQDTTKLLKHYPQSKIFNFNADQKKLEVIKDVLMKFASI